MDADKLKPRIRPKPPCIFGADCKRIGKCKFTHLVPQDTSKKKDGNKSPVLCRYGTACIRPKCPYFHPRSPSSAFETSWLPAPNKPASKSNNNFVTSPQNNEPSSENIPESTPKKKKCRYGAGCHKNGCRFLHPLHCLKSMDDEATLALKSNSELICDGTTASTLNQYVTINDNLVSRKDATNVTPHSILPSANAFPASKKSTKEVSLSASFETSSPSQSDAFSINYGETSGERVPPPNCFGNMKVPYVSDIEQNIDTEPLNLEASMLQSSLCGPASLNNTNTGPSVQRCPARPPGLNFSMKLPPPLGIGSHEMTPDDALLYELLGVDMNGAGSAFTSKSSHSKAKVSRAQNQAKSSFKFGDKTKFPAPAPATPIAVDSKSNLVKDMSQEEISEARRAAFQLRLESQQKGAFDNNDELLSTLLQFCRSNQRLLMNALECSTSLASTDDRVDESHVAELLELNELLFSSISMADSRGCLQDKKKGDTTADKSSVTQEPQHDNHKLPKRKKKSRRSKSANKHQDPNEVKDQLACSTPFEVLKADRINIETSINANSNTTSLKATELEVSSIHSDVINENTDLEPPAHAKTSNEATLEKTSNMQVSNNMQRTEGRDHVYNSADVVQQKKERIMKLLEEERQKAAVAKEKKKSKKAKRFDRWVKEQEELKVSRGESWKEWILKEIEYTEMIKQLLVTEFLRQTRNKVVGLTHERVLSDAHEVLMSNSREAYRVLFGDDCRVVVSGVDNKDLNSRQGNLCYYDKESEMFCVGLDTKKTPGSEIHFFSPENLEKVAARSVKNDKVVNRSFDVIVPEFLNHGDVVFSLIFTIENSHVTSLGSAESLKLGLEKFVQTRNNEEYRAKLEAEAEKKREEVESKRRKEAKARERAAWERRKEEMRREKEEFEEMRREWARERHGHHVYGHPFPHAGYGLFESMFASSFGNNCTTSGDAFYFTVGGIPFRFCVDDDSDGDSFFDDFDDRWEERLEEEKEEENKKSAEILGVQENADARTLKLAYRKMALQYHPDKWKSDRENGMTKEEAEERFKTMQSAYDHLMSNLDE